MGKTIAIATQKGGEGKTATSLALLAGLQVRGFKVLAVDLDPQRNLTFATAAPADGKTVLGLLTRENTTKESIQRTDQGDIIPASKALSKIDVLLEDTLGKPYRLRQALEEVKQQYDFIILDCPPALGTLTANALTAADMVIIPAQADISSIQGIADIWETIKEARAYTNPELKIAGILMTRYNDRANLNKELERQLREEVAPALETRLYDSWIREAIAVKEAKYMQQSIFSYAPTAKVTEDYKNFIDELLKNLDKGGN